MDRTIARTVELLADAPLAEGGWPRALVALSEASATGRAHLIGIGPGSVGLHFMVGMEDIPVADMIAGGVADAGQSWRLASSRGVLELVHEGDYDQARGSVSSEAYDALCERYEIELGVQSVLWQRDESLVGLATLRSRAEGPTTARELARFRALLPYCRRAVRMQRALEAKGTEVTLGALDAVQGAAILIDGDGRVADLNDRAAEVVREGWLRLTVGRISGRVSQDDAQLQRALSAALLGISSSVPERIWLAPREQYPDRPWCEIFTLPVRDWGMVFRPRVLLVIHRARAIDPVEADILRSLLGLTASEADIALRLANGVAREEIAGIRGSSPGTVNFQLKQILQKTGMHREGQLIALVNRLLRH